MQRGDIVTVALAGDFGKPRPALITTVRITIDPTSWNGLKLTLHIMIDKPMTIIREKVGGPFGRLDDDAMLAATRSLALFLGFG